MTCGPDAYAFPGVDVAIALIAQFASTTSLAQLEESGRRLGIDFASEPDVLGDLASIRLTEGFWRNSPLEEAHTGTTRPGGISDPDMFRCNVATYRVVRGHVRPPELDWSGLLEALTDPRRTLPGSHTAGELLGGSLEEFMAHLDANVRYARGADVALFLRAAAVDAGRHFAHCYGTP